MYMCRLQENNDNYFVACYIDVHVHWKKRKLDVQMSAKIPGKKVTFAKTQRRPLTIN